MPAGEADTPGRWPFLLPLSLLGAFLMGKFPQSKVVWISFLRINGHSRALFQSGQIYFPKFAIILKSRSVKINTVRNLVGEPLFLQDLNQGYLFFDMLTCSRKNNFAGFGVKFFEIGYKIFFVK